MNKEIRVFNGGINNVAAPHHINDSQGIYIANADIKSGEITSSKNPKDTGTTVTGTSVFYYKAQDEVVSSTEDRFYVEWAGLLYWSNSAGVLKRYDGTTVSSIGSHSAPGTAPTLTNPAAGLLNGNYTYAITYTHSSLFESPPSAFVTTAPVNQNVLVTFADTPPATATHRNIYRAGGFNPTFNLVATVPIATASYTDNIADFDISRKELTTYNNDPAPTNLDMLVEKQGTFFGALDNKVYFSQEGEPEYWSAYNFVQLPKTITGLGVFGNSIIAFTDSSMYMISGSNINNISLSKLPFGYGCKNKRTVRNVEGRLVWVAERDDYDVICVYDGSGVTVVNQLDQYFNASVLGVATYDSFGTATYDSYSFAIKGAIVSNRKYFLFLDGRTVVADFNDGLKISYMLESVDAAYSKNNSMFISLSGTVYEYLPDFSTYRNVAYRTGDMSDGDLTLTKEYRKIKVNGTGTYTVSVFVDDKKVMDMSTSKEYMPSGTRGKTISLLIETTGYAKIKSISYEYTHLKE